MKRDSHEDRKARSFADGPDELQVPSRSSIEKDCHSLGSSNLRGSVPSCATKNKEELARIVVDCGFRLHKELGAGLLESVYEVVMEKMLRDEGLNVRRQVPVPIEVFGLKFDEGFRADLLVEEALLIELKSVSQLAPVHSKQVLTYLRLLNLPLGLLINFGSATFKEGVKRIVNGPQDFSNSSLRINQPPS